MDKDVEWSLSVLDLGAPKPTDPVSLQWTQFTDEGREVGLPRQGKNLEDLGK